MKRETDMEELSKRLYLSRRSHLLNMCFLVDGEESPGAGVVTDRVTRSYLNLVE